MLNYFLTLPSEDTTCELETQPVAAPWKDSHDSLIKTLTLFINEKQATTFSEFYCRHVHTSVTVQTVRVRREWCKRYLKMLASINVHAIESEAKLTIRV